MASYSLFDAEEEDDRQDDRESQRAKQPFQDDYYGILGLDKNATADDIRSAYRSRSRMFHPDKHSSLDPGKQQEAVLIFNRVKRAHDILSDEHLRAVYDTLGQDGLDALGSDLFDNDSDQTSKTQLILRSKTPKEIREEFEEIQKEKQRRRLEQRSNPKGTLIVGINASEIFEFLGMGDYDEDDDEEEELLALPSVEVSSLSVVQSIDVPLSLKETSTLSGQLVTTNGRGSGHFGTSYRRIVSDRSWVELQFLIGRGPVAVVKGFRSIGEKSHCTAVLSLPVVIQGNTAAIIPSLDISLGRSFTKTCSAEVKGSLGPRSSISSHLVYVLRGRHQVVCSVQAGLKESFFGLFYHHRLEWNDTKVKIGSKVGTKGVSLEYGVETKSSANSIVGATVILGVPSGVSLKLRFCYARQTFIFDILLSDQVLPAAVFYGTVLPVLSYACVKKLVIDRYQDSEEKREQETERKQQENRLLSKKKEAAAVVSLWSHTNRKIVEQETISKGLIIETAFYGKATLVSSMTQMLKSNLLDSQELANKLTDPMTRVIDVKIALQCQVKDSKLSLPSLSKSTLLGFFDPCFMEDKQLFIRYRFRDAVLEVIYDDTDAVELPDVLHNPSSSTEPNNTTQTSS